MALTGDLEHLSIFDIIQLLNTMRKSGTFSIKSSRGESRIIFSNGCIVGANHLNGRVRIGTVLVKMNAVSLDDLEHALEAQKSAGPDRKPLIATLIKMGKLGREQAAAGLKKLIEMTIVELVGWTEGTFTLDTEAIAVSAECSYPISDMEQEISLDAQMVLMDALRIFDERERDRKAGKILQSDEDFFADVVPAEMAAEMELKQTSITADDLGLGELDQLERKIPQPFSVDELFDPLKIHREIVKDMLTGFPDEEQEAFVAFLKKSTTSIDARDTAARLENGTNALVLVSGDEILVHAVLTICKGGNQLVFTADREEKLKQDIDRCLGIGTSPVVVFDDPLAAPALPGEQILAMRRQLKELYPAVTMIQLTSPTDFAFMMQSLGEGIRTVLPRPSREAGRETFIKDMMQFLEAFNSFVKSVFEEQRLEQRSVETSAEPQIIPDERETVPDDREAVAEDAEVTADDVEVIADDRQSAAEVPDNRMDKLKEQLLAFRELKEPSAVSQALLQSVSEFFERSISFLIHRTALSGEKAIGVYAEKDKGITSASGLEVPFVTPSILSDTIEKGQLFFGECDDEALKTHLYGAIGAPRSPMIFLLPMRSLGRTVTLTYADFGDREASAIQQELFEILVNEAGLVLENALYRKHLSKAQNK